MQWRLSQIMIGVSALCILLGLGFASPPIIGFPLLFALYLAIPGILLTGVIWAQRGRRAFFVGALSSAATPWVGAAFIALPEVIFRGRMFNNSFYEPAIASEWWVVQLLLQAPIGAALIGGGAAHLTYRLVTKEVLPSPALQTSVSQLSSFPAAQETRR